MEDGVSALLPFMPLADWISEHLFEIHGIGLTGEFHLWIPLVCVAMLFATFTYIGIPRALSIIFTGILGGVILLVIDKMPLKPRYHDAMDYPLWLCLAIGFCQTLAMVPGVSRSGATIAGALLMGTDKRSAAEFSFFLAMPTMAGAFAYDLFKNRDILSMDDAAIIGVGFVAAFITAVFVVRGLLNATGTLGGQFGSTDWLTDGPAGRLEIDYFSDAAAAMAIVPDARARLTSVHAARPPRCRRRPPRGPAVPCLFAPCFFEA